MRARGAGFSLVGRDKVTPEDRWALAELDGLVVGALADGVSDPLGDGRAGASGAVADEAVGAFVERASRLREEGVVDPAALVRAGFEAAESAARASAVAVGGRGAAAFVGACLDRAGTFAVVKVGDCRAFDDDPTGWRPLTPSDDADRRGGLTAFLGRPVAAEVIVHRDVRRAVLLSDGGWRAGLPAPSALPTAPFALARDLVARARRAGETDDLSALALVREAEASAGDARGAIERLTPAAFVVAGVFFFAAGWVAAGLFGGAP